MCPECYEITSWSACSPCLQAAPEPVTVFLPLLPPKAISRGQEGLSSSGRPSQDPPMLVAPPCSNRVAACKFVLLHEEYVIELLDSLFVLFCCSDFSACIPLVISSVL